MIPSPPWSRISWKKVSKWWVPLHISLGAISRYLLATTWFAKGIQQCKECYMFWREIKTYLDRNSVAHRCRGFAWARRIPYIWIYSNLDRIDRLCEISWALRGTYLARTLRKKRKKLSIGGGVIYLTYHNSPSKKRSVGMVSAISWGTGRTFPVRE